MGLFSPKRPIFLHNCTTFFELPSTISTMGKVDKDLGMQYSMHSLARHTPIFHIKNKHEYLYMFQKSRLKLKLVFLPKTIFLFGCLFKLQIIFIYLTTYF